MGVECHPADSAARAAEGADLVVTATRAREPVLRREWVGPGTHVNAVGADQEGKRELDGPLLAAAGRVVTDSLQQARRDAGDLLEAVREGALRWEQVSELGQLLCGGSPGRRGDEITVFDAQGSALGDVALAGLAWRRAREAGRGTSIDR
jgi:alanine dehydrogenase